MTYPDTRDSEEDEGEVRSDEEDSEGSFSSEGFTTDGEAESDEVCSAFVSHTLR